MITKLLNEVNEKIEILNNLVQDKEYFEKLDKRIEEVNNYVQKQQQEIERLNNIINKLEDFCISMGKIYEEEYKDIDTASIFNICMLDKIKELKGSDKE